MTRPTVCVDLNGGLAGYAAPPAIGRPSDLAREMLRFRGQIHLTVRVKDFATVVRPGDVMNWLSDAGFPPVRLHNGPGYPDADLYVVTDDGPAGPRCVRSADAPARITELLEGK